MELNLIKKLLKVANILDENGYFAEANTLTKIAQKDEPYSDPNVKKLRDMVMKHQGDKFRLNDVTTEQSVLNRFAKVIEQAKLKVENTMSGLEVDTVKLKNLLGNLDTLEEFNKLFAQDRLQFLINKLKSSQGNKDIGTNWQDTDRLNQEISKLKKYLQRSNIDLPEVKELEGQQKNLNEIVFQAAFKVLKNSSFGKDKDVTFISNSLGPTGRNQGWYYLQTGDMLYGGKQTSPSRLQNAVKDEITEITGTDHNLRDKAFELFDKKVGMLDPLSRSR